MAEVVTTTAIVFAVAFLGQPILALVGRSYLRPRLQRLRDLMERYDDPVSRKSVAVLTRLVGRPALVFLIWGVVLLATVGTPLAFAVKVVFAVVFGIPASIVRLAGGEALERRRRERREQKERRRNQRRAQRRARRTARRGPLIISPIQRDPGYTDAVITMFLSGFLAYPTLSLFLFLPIAPFILLDSLVSRVRRLFAKVLGKGGGGTGGSGPLRKLATGDTTLIEALLAGDIEPFKARDT